MNVLIIPEDFRKDQYILKPLFEALFRFHGKPSTKVRICNPPLLQGVTEALKTDRLQEIVDRYTVVDLFILCVDRDGKEGRRSRLDAIERHFSKGTNFLAENAWEELETWLLAGLDLPTAWQWREIRSEISVKERYFERLALQLKLSDGPGGGRRVMGINAAKNVRNILLKCPEDFGSVSKRIKEILI